MNTSRQSLQERFFATSTCFGCGPANSEGLRLRSFPADTADESLAADQSRVLATFRTTNVHDNGLGFVNGGIIATLLDCHSAGSAMLTAERLGWTTGDGAVYPCVTAGLDLRYLRPTPLLEDLHLLAWVVEATEEEISVMSTITHAGKTRAEALVRWRRWRPRTTPAGAEGVRQTG